jgi:hypothetical protein
MVGKRGGGAVFFPTIRQQYKRWRIILLLFVGRGRESEERGRVGSDGAGHWAA